MSTHAVVWVDYHEALVFMLSSDSADGPATPQAPYHVRRAPDRGRAKAYAEDARGYFEHVAGRLSGADAILIVGPLSAKLEFFRYLQAHEPHDVSRVVGIETVPDCIHDEILATARAYFAPAERADAA